MASVNINGVGLEYVESGNGETVLLVHGSLSDYRIWNAQLEAFAASFRVVAYSRRYHWPNDKITETADYSMPEHVDDLAQVIRSLADKPVHLVGHSYGAFVCLLLAINEPELIRSLVLVEPPAVTLFIDLPPKPVQLLKLLLTRPRTAITIIKFAATALIPATKAIEQGDIDQGIQFFGPATLGNEAFNRLSEEDQEMIESNFIKAEFLGSGFAPINDTDVRHIEIPTLLANGQNSPALFHRIVDKLHTMLPVSERIKIANASHRVQRDNPAEFNKMILSFLERQQINLESGKAEQQA